MNSQAIVQLIQSQADENYRTGDVLEVVSVYHTASAKIVIKITIVIQTFEEEESSLLTRLSGIQFKH